MSNLRKPIFSRKIKDIFWPIERSEIKLFLPLGLMMMCMLFNFGSLRSIKDSLVVPNIGAEVISFLKLWLVLPSTIIFTLIYVRLSNVFEYDRLFYLIVCFFLSFFILFTYVLFPQQHMFHPSDETIAHLAQNYPYLKWFIKILGKWSYALMYVFCELWSVVIINLLFWQYANHIFDTDSAKRFYPFLGMIGNLGLIIAGNVLVSFSDLSGISDDHILKSYSNDIGYQCEMVLKPIMKSVVFAGLVAMVLYRYIDHYVLKDSEFKRKKNSTGEKTKTSLSFVQSIKLIMKSKYIGHIVTCGSTQCQSTPARGYTMGIMQSNAPYTKNIKIPIDASQQTLRIQRRCTNPDPLQKPFPYRVQTGTGILTGGTSVNNVGSACNTSNIQLVPPAWYIASKKDVRQYINSVNSSIGI
jgi:ATP/ADP translocase